MFRTIAPWGLATVLLLGCGPNPRCSGTEPHFVVVLKLAARPLPSDTVVHVTYGGSGREAYRLSAPNSVHEVVFCRPANAAGDPLTDPAGSPDALDAGDAGAGAAAQPPVDALYCELWTGGFTKLEVSASGLPTTEYDLAPREKQCTVTRTIVLDAPDAG